MAIKYKDLGELKNMIRDNTMKVYLSMEDFENDPCKKNISYVISDTGWTKVSTLSIDGNRATIITGCSECPIVEHYEKSVRVDIHNKIPGNLLREIVETFARVCNGGAGNSLKGAEAAAQIYKHSETGDYFIYYPNQTVSGAQVTYADDPGMLENRNKHKLVFECHSHNSMGAFWSTTDNDNEKEFGYYMVIGNLNLAKAQYKFRVKYENTYGDLEANQLFNITKEEEDSIFTKSTWGPGNPIIDTRAKTAIVSHSKSNTSSGSTTYTGEYKDYSWGTYWGNYEYASSRKGGVFKGKGSRRGRGRGKSKSSSYYNPDFSSSSYSDSVSAFEEWMKENPDTIIILESDDIYKHINSIAHWGKDYALEYHGWVRSCELIDGSYKFMYKYTGDDDQLCDEDVSVEEDSDDSVLKMLDIITGSLCEDDVVSSEDIMLILTIDDYANIELIFDCTEDDIIAALQSTKAIKVSKVIDLIKLVMFPDKVSCKGNTNTFSAWLKE